MTRTVRVNTVMSADLLARVDAYAAARYEDRSTAIRQLVAHALRDFSQREAVNAYSAGRLTLREFAQALDLDVWQAHDLLASLGVAVAQGAREETQAALDDAVARLRRARR